ncbi:TPA: hypothetical protein ACXYLO_003904 [Legionella anisa]
MMAREFYEKTERLKQKQEEIGRKEKEYGGKIEQPSKKEIEENKKQWLDEIKSGKNNDPAFKAYQDALALKNAIQAVYDQDLIHQPETEQAATRLLSKLNIAIKKWEKAALDNVEIVKVNPGMFKDNVFYVESNRVDTALMNRELTTDCVNGVQAERNLLMKDPGFWNQIAQKINDFLAEYNIGPLFNVDKTHYGIEDKIEEGMDKFDPRPM